MSQNKPNKVKESNIKAHQKRIFVQILLVN